jgi:hypothetical protein
MASMDIPLRLTSPGPRRLVYGLPIWYRLAMALIFAVLAAGLVLAGGAPGPLAWAVLALVALGGLLEDRWEFDAAAGRVRHRSGLVGVARTREFPLAAVQGFRLVALAADTGAPKARATILDLASGARGRLDLVMECGDGRRYLLDRYPIREGARLRRHGERIAGLCGKPLGKG